MVVYYFFISSSDIILYYLLMNGNLERGSTSYSVVNIKIRGYHKQKLRKHYLLKIVNKIMVFRKLLFRVFCKVSTYILFKYSNGGVSNFNRLPLLIKMRFFFAN